MRVVMGDLLTGRRILDVPFVSADWSVELNAPGAVKCTVDLRDPDVQSLDMRNAATPGKSFLAAVVDGVVVEAGPIWARSYDRATGELTLNARGLWSYFDHRTLLPDLGVQPVVDPVTGESAAYANSAWSGLSLGTIGKRIVEQSMTWPGGDLPIVFEADKAGANERNYVGAELPVIGQMLQNLTEVDDGPDIEFRPRWSTDRLGVEWLYRSGDPRIASSSVMLLDTTVPSSPVKDLTVDDSAARMGSLGWCSGGRSADVSLVERSLDPLLLDAGFPLMERVDSSRSSVKEQATLLAYAVELARTGRKSLAQWSVAVHTGGDGEPLVTDFSVGDFVDIKLGGDLFIPDDVYRRRIVNISGQADDPIIKLGLGETYG